MCQDEDAVGGDVADESSQSDSIADSHFAEDIGVAEEPQSNRRLEEDEKSCEEIDLVLFSLHVIGHTVEHFDSVPKDRTLLHVWRFL